MPLLDGGLLRDARLALATLSQQLLRHKPPETTPISLSNGLLGLALAHASLGRVFVRSRHRRRAEELINRSLRRLESESPEPGLYWGLAGVGWVVAHLAETTKDDESDVCASIDAVLERLLEDHWTGPYELLGGLVGLGLYGLERLPRPAGERLLERVVDNLAKSARSRSPGVSWWSDPRWLVDGTQEGPTPDWNLGVAHGVPGVVAFLGLVVSSEAGAPTRRKARALLGEAVTWLLAQELPASEGGCFPHAVAPGLPRVATRLAWCYGDAGVAATLFVAARGAGEDPWEREAIRIGLRATDRTRENSGVVDAGLCHGAAGLAHVFHRLHRGTLEPRFADASRTWFHRALAHRAPQGGFGGFVAQVDRGGSPSWDAAPGFLVGAAGIALALAAATTDIEPSWDRILLLS